ncbi:hypothetical protein RFEPED_0993 [Rickettsia felis str. Pedreira]|uniref:Uncharacterized protein n=1 Tax=Rickettsia felis str. Pedreira TaxID=1359196 RepID=A0A0F3MS63_RICFI|nr:hypothetical protein [Rickettsia felis]KJV58603.1 hypothetical protein RFEPED_0993 [Rickettsia felis str. Pedreira]
MSFLRKGYLSRHCEQALPAWTEKSVWCHSRVGGNLEKSINTANF